MHVLVVNAGSSSLKLTLLGPRDETVAHQVLQTPRATIDEGELREALTGGLAAADVVGHRIVHGGERFREAVPIDPEVEARLRDLVALAPLHQPKSIAALDAVSSALPRIPAFACFDTAFHAEMPEAAIVYALPEEWRQRWGVRRYGFHGLSHAWVARRAPDLLPRAAGGLRVVSCHLGAGASLCAIRDGRSVDTTMGFTPLEGLVMATRSGNVDPGLLVWLLQRSELSVGELGRVLEHESGLLGLTSTADMREVLERASAGDASAQLGLDVYVHRLCAGIGAMAASLGGLDALIFTGGVGENAPEVRERAAKPLRFLGVRVDASRNRGVAGDRDISLEDAAARTLIIHAREDLEIARQVRNAMARR